MTPYEKNEMGLTIIGVIYSTVEKSMVWRVNISDFDTYI